MALPLYPAMVSYVVRNMRACDAAEVAPLLPINTDLGEFGRLLAEGSRAGKVFLHDDVPACAIGGAPSPTPGVWNGWMLATDAFAHVWREVYRYARTGGDLEAEVVSQGCHRMHVVSIEGHPDAGKLLRALGFVCEGTSRWLGRGRENYTMWARFPVEPA